MKKDVWQRLEALELGGIFECEGAYEPFGPEDILAL